MIRTFFDAATRDHILQSLDQGNIRFFGRMIRALFGGSSSGDSDCVAEFAASAQRAAA